MTAIKSEFLAQVPVRDTEQPGGEKEEVLEETKYCVLSV
jgi:hypothetical protein